MLNFDLETQDTLLCKLMKLQLYKNEFFHKMDIFTLVFGNLLFLFMFLLLKRSKIFYKIKNIFSPSFSRKIMIYPKLYFVEIACNLVCDLIFSDDNKFSGTKLSGLLENNHWKISFKVSE